MLQPGKTEWDPAAFFVYLKRIKSRWLVDGIYERASSKRRPIGGSRGRFGVIWFPVPLALLSLIALVPTVIFLGGWIADRRVARRYRDRQSKELPPLPRRRDPEGGLVSVGRRSNLPCSAPR